LNWWERQRIKVKSDALCKQHPTGEVKSDALCKQHPTGGRASAMRFASRILPGKGKSDALCKQHPMGRKDWWYLIIDI
jgi:hypothetical protein